MHSSKLPRVLIYKRTHTGDPWHEGVFGVNDCMGGIRNRKFDAVIGIGGVGAEPRSYGIACRLTWIGIEAHKLPRKPSGYRGSLIRFGGFLLFDKQGPLLKNIAPELAKFMYDGNRRLKMSDGLSTPMLDEIQQILKLARNSPSSEGLPQHARMSRKGLLHTTRCRKLSIKGKLRCRTICW